MPTATTIRSSCHQPMPRRAAQRGVALVVALALWGLAEQNSDILRFVAQFFGLPGESVRAPELPLYGTCTMSTPAIDLNSSPAMW